MTPIKILRHEFVEFIPNEIKEGIIYVSVNYATAVHKCCCGCGNEVVTPITPIDWTLSFDGETISLYPSIGNWSYPCQSHYWIRRNKVDWALKWSREEIKSGRNRDAAMKEKYFACDSTQAIRDENTPTLETKDQQSQESFWQRLKKWFLLPKTRVDNQGSNNTEE